MHADRLQHWTHQHAFHHGNPAGERGTRWVIGLTAVMMVAEIAAGWWYNSMALLADGLHMSSHVVAIGLSALAYAAARRYASDRRFAFGTWKIEVLAGFASSVFLLLTVALMVAGSIDRLLAPQPIRYGEAMLVAAIGLAVNVASALILGHAGDGHSHDLHGPEHHGHDPHRHDPHWHDPHRHGHAPDPGSAHPQPAHAAAQGTDLNLRSAYLHVLADALTSLLALVALAGGWLYGWDWLDPAMGIVGAVVVALWARRLLLDTSRVLLDREMDHPVVAEIVAAVEAAGAAVEAKVTDLHVWRVGRATYACALTVVSHDPRLSAARVRQWIGVHEEVVHATIELHLCEGCTPEQPAVSRGSSDTARAA
jgi:cation diffusion facilitator family transporter